MKKIILAILMFAAITYAQSYKIEKVTGTVKAQTGTEEKWIEVKPGSMVDSKTVIETGVNSSVQLSGKDKKFTLKESSAISISALKKLSVDEFLLALAMENIISAPKKKDDKKSKSTAVYGTKEGWKNDLHIISDDFGIKKLNGAVQLAENDFKETAVVAAKESFRKYPETNSISSYRIYFANILFERGLFEEAYSDFTSIKNLKLDEKESKEVEDKLEQISRKLSSDKK